MSSQRAPLDLKGFGHPCVDALALKTSLAVVRELVLVSEQVPERLGCRLS
jgi:hypothetical protein